MSPKTKHRGLTWGNLWRTIPAPGLPMESDGAPVVTELQFSFSLHPNLLPLFLLGTVLKGTQISVSNSTSKQLKLRQSSLSFTNQHYCIFASDTIFIFIEELTDTIEDPPLPLSLEKSTIFNSVFIIPRTFLYFWMYLWIHKHYIVISEDIWTLYMVPFNTFCSLFILKIIFKIYQCWYN